MAPPIICMPLSTRPQQSPTACCTVSVFLRWRQPACSFESSCCLMDRRARRATRDAPPRCFCPSLRSFLTMRTAQRRSVLRRRRRRHMPIQTPCPARCRHFHCRHCHRPSPSLHLCTRHRARHPYCLRHGRHSSQRGPSHRRGAAASSVGCSWCSTRCTPPRCWLPCSGRCLLAR